MAAGDQKHWFDGLPFAGLNGDGTQKHWFDGLPHAELVAAAPATAITDIGVWLNGSVAFDVITENIGVIG